MTRGISVRFLLGEPSHAQGSRPVPNTGPPGRLGRVISDRELTSESRQSLTVTDPGMSDTRTVKYRYTSGSQTSGAIDKRQRHRMLTTDHSFACALRWPKGRRLILFAASDAPPLGVREAGPAVNCGCPTLYPVPCMWLVVVDSQHGAGPSRGCPTGSS